jgi:hypothetical protein
VADVEQAICKADLRHLVDIEDALEVVICHTLHSCLGNAEHGKGSSTKVSSRLTHGTALE